MSTASLVADNVLRPQLAVLSQRFRDMSASLGLDAPCMPLEYRELLNELRDEIDRMNLQGMLDEQLKAKEIDVPTTRFVVNRLAQLGRIEPVGQLLADMDKLFPVFDVVINYFLSARSFHQPRQRK